MSSSPILSSPAANVAVFKWDDLEHHGPIGDDDGHTVFIIAKRGKRYRSLARVEQGAQGPSTLPRLSRTLAVFSDPANRIALEQELSYSALESFEPEERRRKPIHPFPFISTCLYLGFGCDPADGLLVYSANIESNCFNLENAPSPSCGNIIIDITDLDHLRYCFLWVKSIAGYHATPINAETYVRDEYTEINQEQALKSLRAFELLPMSDLRDCWSNRAEVHVNGDLVVPSTGTRSTRAKPIIEFAMQKYLDAIFEGRVEDVKDWPVERTLDFPGMQDSLFAYCRQRPEKMGQSLCPGVVPILRKFFEKERYVDLSPFQGMTPETVRSILQTLDHIRVLNLSGQLAASSDEILKTLSVLKNPLEELYILDRPDRQADEDPLPMVRAIGEQQWTINKVIMTPILAKSLSAQPWMVAREFMRGESEQSFANHPSPAIPCGLAKSFPVIQLIHRTEHDDYGPETKAWFLGDALLTPKRIATGLLNFARMKLALLDPMYDTEHGAIISHAFATAGSSLAERRFTEVGILPAETFKLVSGFDDAHGPVRDLTPDMWTVVVDDAQIHVEHDGEVVFYHGFRVGMVRSKRRITASQDLKLSPGDVEVVDIRTFLDKYDPSCVADLDRVVRKDRPRGSFHHFFSPLGPGHAITIMEEAFESIESNGNKRNGRWGPTLYRQD